jgi:hypothetical protein
VTLPTITLPDGFPAFLVAGHAIEEDSVYSQVRMGTGHGRTRPRWTAVERVASVSMVLEADQLEEFDTWFEEDLEAGSLPFAAQIANQGAGDRKLWWTATWLEMQIELMHNGRGRVTGRLYLGGEATDVPPPTPPEDEFYDNVVLLLHGDGTQGSTTFTDSSSYGRSPSAAGIIIDTGEKVFGTGSLADFGGGQLLRYADAPEFSLGTGDFTIEFFVRFSGVGSLQYIFGQADSGGSNTSCNIALSRTAGDKIRFVACSAGSAVVDITGTTTILVSTWYYVAARRSGNTFTLRVGTSGATTLEGTGTSSASLNNSSNLLGIGTLGEFSSNLFSGRIDELRWTVGVARDTSTVPTEAFPDG